MANITNVKLCSVCGKKIIVEKNLFQQHEDKRGILCYGSFTPSESINPFKNRQVMFQFADEDGADEDDLPAAPIVEHIEYALADNA